LSDDLRRHLATCEACDAYWKTVEATARVAEALTSDELTSERGEQLRAAFVAKMDEESAAGARFRWRPVLAVAAGVLVVAFAGLTALHLLSAPTYRATLHPREGARFVRLGAQPDEIVRLTDGALTVEVTPLRPGERFRVIVGDAQVEVRGTSFDVRAQNDRLAGVLVHHGKVEVSPESGAPVVLGASERWARPAATSTDPRAPLAATPARSDVGRTDQAPVDATIQAPAESVEVTPRVASLAARRQGSRPASPKPLVEVEASTPSAPAVRPAEHLYQEAWDRMRGLDFVRAASLFEQVVTLEPESPLAEDAAYWGGVALGRADRSLQAVMAFRGFLESYPESTHAGEAAAMLGWMLVDQGETVSAKHWFEVAARSTVKAARESGLRGLAAMREKEARAATGVAPAPQ
jgi:TolA-binding protein